MFSSLFAPTEVGKKAKPPHDSDVAFVNLNTVLCSVVYLLKV